MARRKIQVKSKKVKSLAANAGRGQGKKIAKLSKKNVASKKVKKEELLEISQEWKKLHQQEKTEPEKKETIRGKPDDKKTQDDKRLLMWAGASFFMVLILFFWILNIKNVFKADIGNNTEKDINWNEITNEFSEAMEDIKSGLSEFKDQAAEMQEEENISGGERAVLPSSDEISEEENKIEILKERLEELEKKVEED